MALVSKYRFRLAGASLLQIMTDLRECRAAGDRRCGNQYSCREAPKPLDAHRRPCLRYRLRTETYLAAGSAETHARSRRFPHSGTDGSQTCMGLFLSRNLFLVFAG